MDAAKTDLESPEQEATSVEGEVKRMEDEARKASVLAHLSSTPFCSHGDPQFFHGRLFPPSALPPAPDVEWRCDFQPRRDEDAPTWLTATEYLDLPAAAEAKVGRLAELLTLSQRTVVYRWEHSAVFR